MASDILLREIRELEPDASNFDYNPPLIKSSSGKAYYGKVGSIAEEEQFTGEIESLKYIAMSAPGIAPRVLVHGKDESGQLYFISEYVNISHLNAVSAPKLATRLATEMHAFKSEKGFGFHVPTYCGATRLKNGWYDTWEECYRTLIGDLIDGLRKKPVNKELCAKGELVQKFVIPYLLRPLKVDPVLLHGDLWSGNVGTDPKTNEPVIFDPSSFYGHNEADLAIARIFGGFPESFFKTYHEKLPKSEPVDQYDLRVDLYELFHYLNHTLIFGGGSYATSALKKMDTLLNACPVS